MIRCAICCFARVSSVLLLVAVYHQRTTGRRWLTVDMERSADVTLEEKAAVGSFRIPEALLHILSRPRHCAGRRNTRMQC